MFDFLKPFFNAVLLQPIINLLVLFYIGFSLLHIPGSFGWSIIALTVLIRLFLYPMTATQLRSMKKLADLKPHLDHIKEKHGHDKQRHQVEQMKLYKEHGVNPAAGCLPMLIQFPVILALYNVFFSVLGKNNLTEMIGSLNEHAYHPMLKITNLDLTFFGVNLTTRPDEWQKIGVWLLLVPVVTGLLQFLQTKVMMPASTDKNKKLVKKDKKSSEEDMAATMQTQMMFITPVLFATFAYSFPLGLALYWNTQTVFGIIQQVLISGWGGLAPYINKITKTQETT